jgi:2-polyprenyl-6-methoxyphenol hydroxylase-like FAD-dependent oxidoreductase
MHRDHLKSTLESSLPEKVHLHHTALRSFTQNSKEVTAYFEDGSQRTADIMIGADGINSLVRTILFPSVRPKYCGYKYWRATVDMNDFHHSFETWGDGMRFGVVPLYPPQVFWFGVRKCEAGWNPHNPKDELLKCFGHWHQPIPSLISNTDPSMIHPTPIHKIPPMNRWSYGRVQLHFHL